MSACAIRAISAISLIVLCIVLIVLVLNQKEGFQSVTIGKNKYLDKIETYTCTESFYSISFKPDEIELLEKIIPKVNKAISKYYPGVDNSAPWVLGLIEISDNYAQVYDNYKIILSADLFDKYFGWECMTAKILLYMRLGILYGDTQFINMPWKSHERAWQYALRYVNCGAFK